MLNIILRSILIVILVSATTSSTDKKEAVESFILAQHWPVTSCMGWKFRSLENACKIPANATWSIRGLLRPAVGNLNSNNCSGNSSLKPLVLESIKDDLETCWPDFLEDKYNQTAWEREWSRHGRCTERFQGSPLEYFSKGCQLWRKYPIEALLASGNIFPGKSYSLHRIHDALKLASNDNTFHVVCQKMWGKHYLAEIQICFAKNLTETSCDGLIHVSQRRGFIGSCPRYGLIRYPTMFQQSGPPSTKRSQAPKSSNCKPGKTFRGTPNEAMLCIRQLVQRKIMKAKLARARKLKIIKAKLARETKLKQLQGRTSNTISRI